MQQTVSPQQLSGTIAAIPSKSWAHRELIAAALGAPDHAVLVRFRGGSNDIEATCRALRGLGAKIERLPGTGARVEGISRAERNTLTETPVLDCGESGTTLRYLLPVAAALNGPAGVIFTGSGRLPARPQEPLAGELERHGITLDYAEASPGALLPVRLTGRLLPGAYALSGAVSSQFLGGLLYALSVLDGPSTLAVKDRLESEPYVRMTLSALAESGVEIAESRTDQGLPLWTIAGRGVLTPPEDVQVEGDWSNAAFWLCAGALTQNPEGIAVEGLSLTSLQGDRAVVDILSRLGAQVESSSEGPVGTVRVKPPKNGAALRGQTIDARQIPDLV
ncbi:3-phosphoshikimate 1-carboxyvinyltransferase, partial [Sutterella wadsworthensis]